MAFPAGLRVGRYEVVRKLGQGGFGILYVGRDVELDREVALKFLRPEHLTRPDVVQRFLQEARSAAKIQHAGIVTVFECGQVIGTGTRADDTVYIAMELLHGESLHVRLKRERRLAPDLAVNITRQVCSALMAAHAAGIVHRDLKPDNLFLVPDSAVRGGVRVKILDFGVAKLADGQFDSGVRTHSAMLLGTPMYMSPEQCKSSAKVDHRSDIYAVGCILFQLLCGRAPYEGDAGELIAQHQLAPIPTPRSFAPDVPPPLEALVTHMLAKAPDERPSMDAVESALASLDATSVAARAQSSPIAHAATHESPTSVTTIHEGAGEQTGLEAKRQRRNLVLGAVGVIVFGALLGVIVTRGGKEPDRVAHQPIASPPADAAIAIDAPPIAPVLEVHDAAVAELQIDAAIEEIADVETGSACDFVALKKKGDDYLNNGMDMAALSQFEAALRCKYDSELVKKAFLAACRSKSSAKAKLYFSKLPANLSTNYTQICLRFGISVP
jgi:tRNA A-37 threonylcarbamoyl transferase component Bud32